jgi:hypothetical protein
MSPARDLSFGCKYWAHRFGPAPFLPILSRAEMDELGLESWGVVLVTGDAYMGA